MISREAGVSKQMRKLCRKKRSRTSGSRQGCAVGFSCGKASFRSTVNGHQLAGKTSRARQYGSLPKPTSILSEKLPDLRAATTPIGPAFCSVSIMLQAPVNAGNPDTLCSIAHSGIGRCSRLRKINRDQFEGPRRFRGFRSLWLESKIRFRREATGSAAFADSLSLTSANNATVKRHFSLSRRNCK